MPEAAARPPRHVLIYGPPGAGKLTVARCVVEHYGMKLLDNHLTLDVALRLFPFGTKECWELVDRMRLDLLASAARAGLDVVSTLVFSHPDDRGHVARLAGASENAGAVMSFVQLLPRRSVLEFRVTQPSRQGTRKVRDVAALGRLLETFDLETRIHDEDLSIDNSELSPEEVAGIVAAGAGLEPAVPSHGDGTGCTAPPSSSRTEPPPGDRAAEVMVAMVAMFATGDLSALHATVHPDYLDHQGLGGRPLRGTEGFATVVNAARRGHLGLEVTIEDLITNPDRAAARLRWAGTNSDGDHVERETLEIVRIEEGRAVEHWGRSS
jgi:hypothetical protein